MVQIPDAPYIREAELKGYLPDYNPNLRTLDDDNFFVTDDECGYDR